MVSPIYPLIKKDWETHGHHDAQQDVDIPVVHGVTSGTRAGVDGPVGPPFPGMPYTIMNDIDKTAGKQPIAADEVMGNGEHQVYWHHYKRYRMFHICVCVYPLFLEDAV